MKASVDVLLIQINLYNEVKKKVLKKIVCVPRPSADTKHINFNSFLGCKLLNCQKSIKITEN